MVASYTDGHGTLESEASAIFFVPVPGEIFGDANGNTLTGTSGNDPKHFPPDGKLRVYRSRTGGNEWEALTNGLPQRDCYVNVLRDAMAVDSLDPCGIYFGTSGGQVYGSADSGDSWTAIVRDLPAVLSVEAQTL